MNTNANKRNELTLPIPYCQSCNKKLQFLSFTCRCTHYFCNAHRNPELHKCTFDYKEYGQSIIEKTNPKIKLSKL